MKGRIKFQDGDEEDFLTPARHFICRYRSKIIKYVKRKYNKRVRRFAKVEIKKEIEDINDEKQLEAYDHLYRF